MITFEKMGTNAYRVWMIPPACFSGKSNSENGVHVANILEPHSPNPVFDTVHPLGINAVKTMELCAIN